MSDISAVLEGIKKERLRKQPTPPVGTPVQWYPAGDKAEPRAALVTAVEGPGRVALVIFSLNAHPVNKMGVHFHEHEVHDERNNPQTVRNGAWGYVPGSWKMVPPEHFLYHERLLESREKQALAQQEAELQAAEASAARKPKASTKETVGA